MNDKKSEYEDIINLPHHVSLKHPHMPRADRAAQFSPFAALTGHDDAIKETARITAQKKELTEDAKAILDSRLHLLAETESEQQIEVTYFLHDKLKPGGEYITVNGSFRAVDDYNRVLILSDKTKISIDDIIEINIIY